MANYGDKVCQSLVGAKLDELIVEQVLSALEPSALEISLRVAEDIEQERKTLSTLWEKQLERAKYEVERAYRQYNASEPENRLVTRNLEKKWEEALAGEEKLKYDYTKFLAEQPSTLSVDEREAIRKLASDIPALWSSVTTTVQERQEIIRLLIERILVSVEGDTEKVSVEIHWAGGYKSTSNFNRPVAKLEQLSYYNEASVIVSPVFEFQAAIKLTLRLFAGLAEISNWSRRNSNKFLGFNSKNRSAAVV